MFLASCIGKLRSVNTEVLPGLLQNKTKWDGVSGNNTTIILLYVILERGVEQQGMSNPDKELLRELSVPMNMSTHSHLSP